MSLLYGIHDRQGAHIVPSGGWVLDVVALSENPQPTDYAALRGDINWIVRLQWGFGTTGNIPLPNEYDLMRTAAAAYVRNSRGANIYIIGNEPNHEQERPNGVFITPAQYVRCFVMVRDAIKQADSTAQVLPAPCAPYHANPMNWLDYWREMLDLIAANGGCDGIAVHAYTRSSNPDDIDTEAEMGPPLKGQSSGFQTYQDALSAVPLSLIHLPAYITEFNELLPDGWHDANTGVVQAAYKEINLWNTELKEQKIYALILYRWPNFDKWHIEGKGGVIADFQAAVGRGYASPTRETTNVQVHIPVVISPGTPQTEPSLPPRIWDERLTARLVTVETPPLAPGQQFWRAVKVQWYDEQESQGRHHIYVEGLDENSKPKAGFPFLVQWLSGQVELDTNGRSGFDAGNFPMSKSLSEFSVKMTGGGYPSEKLVGIGMGDKGNAAVHTSTGVTFQLATMPSSSGPTPVEPPKDIPMPSNDNWARSIAFTARWEGGYQNVANDVGNWTGGAVGVGENKGTNWGVSAASYPHLDIKNLTREQAHEIFKRDYWAASGADNLNWPACLIVFDSAILHGVGTAKAWQSEVGTNAFAFAAKRLRVYTKMSNWDYWGRGWVNRTADLLEEAGK